MKYLATYESRRFNLRPSPPRLRPLEPTPRPLPLLVGVEPEEEVEPAEAALLTKLAKACCCCNACKLAIIDAVALKGFPPPPDNPAREPKELVANAACK